MQLGALVLLVSGCSEFAARRHARVGNVYFRAERYADAIREYALADELSSGIPEVSLNRGLACRKLMLGAEASSAEQSDALQCALAALSRLKELRPHDSRGDRFFLQTLFDAQRFDALIAIYEERLKQQPDDLVSINELIGLYSRVDRWVPALRWGMRRARIARNDAEAQYEVAAMLFNYLQQKQTTHEASYAPATGPKVYGGAQTQPAFAKAAATTRSRPRLANVGLTYLSRAIELRPDYGNAMVFMHLMSRQEYGALDESGELELLEESSDVELLDEERLRELQKVPHGPAGPDPGAQPAAPASGTPA